MGNHTTLLSTTSNDQVSEKEKFIHEEFFRFQNKFNPISMCILFINQEILKELSLPAMGCCTTLH
jgi:hypothetical protein